MSGLVLIVAELVLLHAPQGRTVEINPDQVTTMRGPEADAGNKHLTDAVHCMISTSDGKFVAVVETCDEVRDAFRKAERD